MTILTKSPVSILGLRELVSMIDTIWGVIKTADWIIARTGNLDLIPTKMRAFVHRLARRFGRMPNWDRDL
jgi:hypothetical protein